VISRRICQHPGQRFDCFWQPLEMPDPCYRRSVSATRALLKEYSQGARLRGDEAPFRLLVFYDDPCKSECGRILSQWEKGKYAPTADALPRTGLPPLVAMSSLHGIDSYVHLPGAIVLGYAHSSIEEWLRPDRLRRFVEIDGAASNSIPDDVVIGEVGAVIDKLRVRVEEHTGG